MIYLLYGNNTDAVRKKVRDIVAAQIAKKPDALSFRIGEEEWKKTNLEELLGGQGLFVQKYIIVFDRLLRLEEVGEELLSRMDDLAKSEHIIIFSEGELTKEILKKIEKKAEKVQEFSQKQEKAPEKFNIFALADAFGSRNKKEFWLLYQRAILAGIPPEEVHRILFWQVKAMLAASHCDSAEEAGLKPFVYKKALSFGRNFSEEELIKLSSRLVALYHESRRGSDFEVEMERFVLKV